MIDLPDESESIRLKLFAIFTLKLSKFDSLLSIYIHTCLPTLVDMP